MISPSVVWLATLMASPALYLAFVTGELAVQDALARYLLAVAAAALMMCGLRYVTANYGQRPRQLPLRRRTDETPDAG